MGKMLQVSYTGFQY